MKWFDNNNKKSEKEPRSFYIKIGKQTYQDSERVVFKMSTSILLKDYLDKNDLSYFKFGIDNKKGEAKLFVLFSDNPETSFCLRNDKGNHKTVVGVNDLIKDLKEFGIDLPLVRLKIEAVVKDSTDVDVLDNHLFEVMLK